MEQDELRNMWAQYDRKLNDHLKLNEDLLKKLNLYKSRSEMQKPLIYEIVGIIAIFIFTIYVAASSIRFIDEPKYCIPGFISALIGLVFLIFAIVKTNKFLSIDYYDSSVIKLQKEITTLNKLILRLRKYELALFPFLIIPTLPILFKAIHNIDIYKNTTLFAVEFIFILGIGLPLSLWINKHFYDTKFRNTERFLKEIDDFEKDKERV